ncbi:MAG: hypothetical protein IPG84_16415 [Betaproteobacteria bacterium]|nr:hypothetical protein [Betaproteobacteria bacterium]
MAWPSRCAIRVPAWMPAHSPASFRRSSRPPGGMGLGLSMSRTIVEAHGGALSVHSVPGQGSTFRIELPLVAS